MPPAANTEARSAAGTAFNAPGTPSALGRLAAVTQALGGHTRWAVSALALVLVLLAGPLGWGVGATVPAWSGAGWPSVGFWPAAGVVLAALVRTPAAAAAVGLGLWLTLVSRGLPAWVALAVAAGSTGSAALAARHLQQQGFNPRLERRRDLWLLLWATLLAPVLSAANGLLWLAMGGVAAPAALPGLWLQWWSGEALGGLGLGVALITANRRGLRAALSWPQRARTLGLLGASALSIGVAFALPPGLGVARPLLLLAPALWLSWLAMRSGLAVASAGSTVLAVAMLLATAAGQGPFAQAPQGQGATNGTGLALWWALTATWSALLLLTHVQIGELGRREERWRLAVEGSDLGVADWDLRTHSHYSSSRWRALLADPEGEQAATLERWLSQVHPEDHAPLRSVLAVVDAPIGGTGLRREVRLRVGEAWRWFDLHLVVAERDPQGQPLRVVAALADVGARHRAEERQRLSVNVFRHLHEGLAITDTALRLVEANPSYCRIVGQPAGVPLGEVPPLLRANGVPADLLQLLHTQGRWQGEVETRRHDGSPCTLQVTASTVHDPDGGVQHHVLVVSDVTEQHRQAQLMAHQAHFDPLTRLPNRARLTELMAQAMAATDHEGCLLAVCYLDLDHFKAVNDLQGHEAGNRLLTEVAQRLRGALRTRSQGFSDVAARIGGDEFVLLLRASTVDEARTAVERVLQVVAQPVTLKPDGLPEVVTASIGATVYPLDAASDADTLLRHADHAMYGVKQSGRNGFLFFDPENSRRQQQRVLALGQMQEALDRDQFVLHYQPKVDLASGQVLGVEALLRWNHPERGLVPPAQFLPVIENTGLSASVGDHVLAQALSQLAAWQSQGLDLSVSVNISARHLQEPDFAQRLAELLARHPLPLGPKLELEVLETAALQDIDHSSAVLQRCAALGVRCALDDFGTGYSTLTYLKRLPIQVLKIDRSFVNHMLSDEHDRAIVDGVIGLARTFDCQVVAEGVESGPQAQALLAMGCHVGQGLGIAGPMPAEQVAPWVQGWRAERLQGDPA